MKKIVITLGIVSLLFSVFYSCKKDETALPPTVETASADNIYNTSARIGGRVSDDGGAEVTERGVFWDTTSNPELSGTKLQLGTGVGTFYDTLKGLVSGTKYYVKAYAINKEGLSYGEETYFTTQISLPTVITSEISEVTPTSARVGGNVTDDGGFEVTKRGVYWGTHANPQQTGIKLEMGSGKGEFSQTLTGLSRTVYYYVVSYATNIKGTSYGEEIMFRTDPVAPEVSTTEVINITPHSAEVGGNVTSNGGAEVTERGIYWGTSPSPQNSGTKLIIGNGSGLFSTVLETLEPATEYYFTAYAINNVGTTFGSEESFTTPGKLPEARIIKLTGLTPNSVTIIGRIVTNDLSTSVSIDYGTSIAYGESVNSDTLITNSVDTAYINITGLSPNEEYHVRIIIENELGTAYSHDATFRTVITGISGSVTDIEDNTYATIGIGYQRWMTENLRTTTYNDGEPILAAKKDSLWDALDTVPGYCWYKNDSVSNSETNGALYNWHAVNSEKLCPDGWKVPSDSDYVELLDYMGGAGIAGGLLKETGIVYWNSPNKGATDDFEFAAYGGGKRLDNGVFDYKKVEGNWWCSNNYSTLTAHSLQLLYNYTMAFQSYSLMTYGLSVRCLEE